MFSAIVQSKSSIGRLCLLDGSAAMLEQARRRFPTNDHVEYRVADMANADLGNDWDLVISALAIHHLADDEKRDLYRRIRGALKPDGLFVNAEQVAGSNAVTDERYSRIWLEQVRQLGVSERAIAKARDRMSYDKCASVSSQLQWLTDVGFSDVDCSFKSWRFAVFSGRA
jgi:ubiquinone/menaquinone biosynthesis C-methylase UbiE